MEFHFTQWDSENLSTWLNAIFSLHSMPHFCTIKLQLVSSCVHFLVNCLSKSACVECCRGAQRSDGGRPTLEPQCGSNAGESAGAGGALPLAQFASAGGGRSGARRLQRVARATAAIRRVLQRRVRSVNFFVLLPPLHLPWLA
jgi:hypothetical protein